MVDGVILALILKHRENLKTLFCLKPGKFELQQQSKAILKHSLLLVFLLLISCSNDIGKLEVSENSGNFEDSASACVESKDHEVGVTKTLAETEKECAEEVLVAKKKELDILFQKIVIQYKQEVKKHPNARNAKIVEQILESQKKFNAFVENYGERYGEHFGSRFYSWAVNGAMFDLLVMRINHLKLLAKYKEFNITLK